ncbi:MAG: hypothetical protein A2Y61_05710 [Chloroflexi bacterium RBG_13_60_13]|nr:MAG: hypothetical protein A2Y61_05710 [Chloroflexi bacterium RBG_13_60_13]
MKRGADSMPRRCPGRSSLGAGTREAFSILALAVLAAAAAWAPQRTSAAPPAQENPRLASLDIDIWPEFDRPATLVIIHAALADDVELPATMSLHIPASTDGPSAVASAAVEGSTLTNLDYETTEAEDSLLLEFTTPDRLVQVEFYDVLAAEGSDRTYTYVWPGDLAVGEVRVRVQEPVGATSLSVEPDIGAGTLDVDGLVYRSADLGALESGKTLTIAVRYQKTDPRTSLEILGAAKTESGGGVPSWILPVAIVALVVAAAGAVVYWRFQRRAIPARTEAGAGPRRGGKRHRRPRETSASQDFCTQCGHQLDPGNRFCPQCGTRARGS